MPRKATPTSSAIALTWRRQQRAHHYLTSCCLLVPGAQLPDCLNSPSLSDWATSHTETATRRIWYIHVAPPCQQSASKV